MVSKKIARSFSLLILLNLSACSAIKSIFPDKTKEYQLITEIPVLVVPADLSNDAIRNSETDVSDIPVYRNQGVAPDIDDNGSTTDENVTEEIPEPEETIYVDLLEFSGGATRIRIEDTIERNWRTVGKALSRNSIEITARDEQDRIYYVQYDADFKKVEDGSLWDEVLFIFGSDPAQEKEFRVRLAENGSLTEVIVLDKNDKPTSKGPGFKLLRLLYETIKEDLAGTN